MALEGIRVLDLSRLAPGPYGTMILGDLGAEIIKVERPPTKEWEKRSSTFPAIIENTDDEKVLAFVAPNRNKKSIIVDLKLPEGRTVVHRLAKTADVMLEQFRPGVVKRLGIDYETIKKINPRIIYCSLSGYGQDGPYGTLAGHDLNYISMAGAQAMIGTSTKDFAIPMNFLADYAAGGMHAVIGILSALIARNQTGKGQFVDIAMFDGVISLLAAEVSRFMVTGVQPNPRETFVNGGTPWYSIYECKDHKYITIACVEAHFWVQLCHVLGRDDFIPYQNDLGEKRQEIFAAFKKIFLTKNRDEWFDMMQKADDIPVGKIYSIAELLKDPQTLHRKMVVEIDHPTVGKVKQVGVSVKLSETPGRVRNTGSLPGQDTSEILRQSGFSTAEIKALKAKNVVIGK